MTEHTKPKVTIDLAEYNELLEAKKDMPYDEAYGILLNSVLRERPSAMMGGKIDIGNVIENFNRSTPYTLSVERADMETITFKMSKKG